MRELKKLPVGDPWMWATLHPPQEPVTSWGLLLLNAGQVPREGHGRLSVELGDALAAEGVKVLRVDLPGLGDSPGALPERCDVLWRFVEEGGQVNDLIDLLEYLHDHDPVQRWVVGGLCGAAVNAIFAAARRPDLVAGLLLLEPELFLVECAVPQGPGDADEEPAATSSGGLLRRLRTTDSWLRVLTGESRFGPRFRSLRRLLLPWVLSRAPPPENLNEPLALALAQTLTHHVPTLTVTAQGLLREAYLDQVLGRFAPKKTPALRRLSIPDTNHVLTSGHAKEKVIEATASWMEDLMAAAPAAAKKPGRAA